MPSCALPIRACSRLLYCEDLVFAGAPKNARHEPLMARRVPSIIQRRWVTIKNGSKTLIDAPKRIKRWWVTDATGNCLFAIRYGSKVLEIEKGKTAVVVGKPDQLVPTIETIITAINAGELDGQLSEMGLARPIRKAAK